MSRGARPVLVLAGLGLSYPEQATLEVLRELSRCDTLFSNLSGADSMRFLTMFCGDVRTIAYQGERDEGVWTRKIFSALKPGRRVGFVTRGHPLISGSLAKSLLDRAGKAGVEIVNFPSVSTIDSILAMAGETLSVSSMALQVYDSRLVTEGSVALHAGIPAILYLGLRRGRDLPARLGPYIDALAGRISKRYPLRHRVFLYGPRYDVRRLEPVAVSGLRARLRSEAPLALSSLILFIPAVRPLKPRHY